MVTTDGGKLRSVGTVVLVSPSSSEPLFELGESQERLVGMLPLQAWREYADEGRILAAVEQNPQHPDTPRVLGYAAYRLPRQEVVLAHLVVHPDARGQRIARQLVEHISEKYESRRGIQAKCRRDYEASKAWPGLGFIAQGDLLAVSRLPPEPRPRQLVGRHPSSNMLAGLLLQT